MIEPTDNEIIMYVSILQVIKEKIEDEEKRDEIMEALGEILFKYNNMRRGAKYEMVKRFKQNVKDMDLNSKECAIDTREQ